jgi:hypothetical protein
VQYIQSIVSGIAVTSASSTSYVGGSWPVIGETKKGTKSCSENKATNYQTPPHENWY